MFHPGNSFGTQSSGRSETCLPIQVLYGCCSSKNRKFADYCRTMWHPSVQFSKFTEQPRRDRNIHCLDFLLQWLLLLDSRWIIRCICSSILMQRNVIIIIFCLLIVFTENISTLTTALERNNISTHRISSGGYPFHTPLISQILETNKGNSFSFQRNAPHQLISTWFDPSGIPAKVDKVLFDLFLYLPEVFIKIFPWELTGRYLQCTFWKIWFALLTLNKP
jgi:hypothetical protein